MSSRRLAKAVMHRWAARLAAVLLGVCVGSMPGDAGAQGAGSTAASRATLKRHIERAPVVVVNPAAIAAARERVETRPVPADAGSAPAPGAAPPAAPAADAAPAATVAPPPKLARGQLYFVPLEPQQEKVARAVVTEQIAALSSVPGSNVQAFSGVVRQVTDNDVEVQLKPYVLVGQPLRYDPQTKKFAGTVVVGVADVTGSRRSATLSAPLLFEVLESAQRVSLGHLSPPFERFDVPSGATGEPVTLRIASNFSREGVSVTVPVERTLFVEVDNDQLRGLGLQTTRVTVRAVGGATAPTGSVSLSASGAFLDNNAPRFDDQGLAHAELRSDSPGQVVVKATATGYVTAESVPLTVVWPWQTLVATSIGGLVGGFIRLGSRIRRRMNGLRLVVGLVIAALTGLLVFALYVLGVKLLPVRFGVEVGDLFAFAAAGLGGWLGSGVLPQLSAPQD